MKLPFWMQNIHGNRFTWKDRHLSNCAFIQPICTGEAYNLLILDLWLLIKRFQARAWTKPPEDSLTQKAQLYNCHRKWAEINTNTHWRPTKLPASTEHTGFMGRDRHRSGTAHQLSRGMKVLKSKQKWINTDTHSWPTKLPPSTEHMGFMVGD